MLLKSFGRLGLMSAVLLVSSLGVVSSVNAGPYALLKTEKFGIFPLAEKVQLSPDRMKRSLRKVGYSNISIVNRRAPGFTVKACKGNKRFLLRVHRRGDIVERENIGRCNAVGNGRSDGLTPPQVRKDLRDRGFEEIRFLDRDLPVYVVTACKGDKRLRLRMNRWAAITKRVRLGRCTSDIDRRNDRQNKDRVDRRDRRDANDRARRDRNRNRFVPEQKRPPQIRKTLQDRGFDRITFTDRRLPTYVVRACKNNRRMELRIDGSGWIRGRKRLGRCEKVNAGMRPPQVRQALRTRGFTRILFTNHKLPVYVVEACRHDRKFKLRVDRFARVMKRTRIGRCGREHVERTFRPREVADILRRRGYREINFFDRTLPRYGATACKRGQKFRMRINRFAEIKKRRRSGFCRPPVTAPPIVEDYEEVDEEQISGTGQIDPETCQTYLDALVRRNRIHFDVASASLRRGSYSLLTRLSRVMNRCPSSRIEISGHTDSDGSRPYNRDLSRRRAKTVAGFLAREGISLRRMTAFGYGEDQPLMRYERTERDKARNRRIEFTVIWGDDDDKDDDDDYRRSRR